MGSSLQLKYWMLTKLLELTMPGRAQAIKITNQMNCIAHVHTDGTSSLLSFASAEYFRKACTYVSLVLHGSHSLPTFTEDKAWRSAVCYSLPLLQEEKQK